MQRFLIDIFSNTKSKYYFWVSDLLAITTIVSIISIVLETVPGLIEYKTIFNLIEIFTVAIFSVEYALRFFISKPRWRYVFSFFGIVDLISILPTFLGLGNLTFLKSARALRIIRLLRIVRLSRLSHLKMRHPETTLGIVALNSFIYLAVLFICLLFVGSLIYIVEPSTIASSIPVGMWWSFEIFVDAVTVVPASVFGGAVYVFGKFVGLLLVGFLIGIVGNLFNILILGKK